MTDFTPGLKKPNDESTDLDKRSVRALTECMSTLPKGGDIYEVVSESGKSYAVDMQEGRCSCSDHKHRGVRCKHLRRVAYATGSESIPAWADTDAVDPLLGKHLDGTPRQAAADGGSLGGEGDDASEEDPRSECWCSGKSLPCWEHY